MHHCTKLFPTRAAEALAEAADLYIPYRYRDKDVDAFESYYYPLIEFQQMSVACDFSDCLIAAYHGFKLNEEQVDALVAIYESTRATLPGMIINELMGLTSELLEGEGRGNYSVSSAGLVMDMLQSNKRTATQ